MPRGLFFNIKWRCLLVASSSKVHLKGFGERAWAEHVGKRQVPLVICHWRDVRKLMWRCVTGPFQGTAFSADTEGRRHSSGQWPRIHLFPHMALSRYGMWVYTQRADLWYSPSLSFLIIDQSWGCTTGAEGSTCWKCQMPLPGNWGTFELSNNGDCTMTSSREL